MKNARSEFEMWLRAQGWQGNRKSLPQLMSTAPVEVSASSAYRAACDADLRGRRFNRSRYDRFWRTLNWALPDSVLARVWRTSRQNLRAKRSRLEKGAPRWRALRDRRNPVYQAAVRVEELKANKFTGLRPR